MYRWLILPLCISACATAHEEAHGSGDGAADAAVQGAADALHQSDAAATTPADAAPTGGCAFTGVLATYSFAGAAGNQASSAATSTANGMIAGPLGRSATLTAVSGATSINSSNWATTAQLDATKYYALTLTPPTGCTLALTSASIDAKASSTGPTTAALATNADNFVTTIALSTSAPSAPTLAINGTTTAVEIRIYGYAASSTSGTLRLQNTLTISGSLH